MTPEQKELVKSTWKQVLPIQAEAARLFYGHLFETYPEVKPYFKRSDMQVQGKSLMKMINTAVNALDNLEPLIEPISQLGRSHVKYGVKEEDYDKVAHSLLWTLEEGLGQKVFTTEARQAWTDTYMLLAGVMKEATYENA